MSTNLTNQLQPIFDCFPMENYSKNALTALLRQRTSENWHSTAVTHNHYVIFNDYNEDVTALATQLQKILHETIPSMYSAMIPEQILLENPERLQNERFNRDCILYILRPKDAPMDEADLAHWEQVQQIASSPDACTLILVTTSEIYEKRFRPHDNLHYRFFTRETQIRLKEDFTPAEIHERLNLEMDNLLPFRRTEAFDARMSQYLEAVYKTADLKRMDFINDMLRRVNSLYYMSDIEDDFLTEACVPYWNENKGGEDAENSEEPNESEESKVSESPDHLEPTETLHHEEVLASNGPSVEETVDEQDNDNLASDATPIGTQEPENLSIDDNETSMSSAVSSDTPEDEPSEPEPLLIPKFQGNVRQEEVASGDVFENETNSSTPDSTNILVLALSTLKATRRDKSGSLVGGYTRTTCIDMDGIDYDYWYQLAPVPKMLALKLGQENQRLDKVFILASTETIQPISKDVHVDGHPLLLDNCTGTGNSHPSALDFFTYEVNEALGSYSPEYTVFTYSNGADNCITSSSEAIITANSIEEILWEMLSEIRKTNRPRLFVDIHGGLRQQQMILNGVISLLEDENIPINNTDIYSVEYDNGKSKIVFADESIRINKFVSGMKELTNYARINSLVEYFDKSISPEGKSLLEALEAIGTSIQFCNAADFERGIKQLPAKIDAVRNMPKHDNLMTLFLDDITMTFQNLLGEFDVLDEIEWCMDKGFYQQTLSIIEARMPEYLISHRIIKYDEKSESAICEEENIDATDTKRLFPEITKYIGLALQENLGTIFVNKVLRNDSRDFIKSRITGKPKSYPLTLKKSFCGIRNDFKGDEAVTLFILHLSLKRLRNNMVHVKDIGKLNTKTVVKRIEEYISLARFFGSQNTMAVEVTYQLPSATKPNNKRGQYNRR